MGQITELVGSQWRPVKIDATSVPDDSQAFIRFEIGDRVLGHGGCNPFFGTYKTSNTGILFSALSYTRMACSQPVMDRENALFDALEKARSVERVGAELRILDSDGRELVLLMRAN